MDRKTILLKRREKIDEELRQIALSEYEAREEAHCQYMRNSNTPCLLDKHEGPHKIPCTNHYAHGQHTDYYKDTYTECSGYAFDRT